MIKFLTSLFLFFAVFFAKADQLVYLTLNQAVKAVEYLKKQDHVILWCACCGNDVQTYVKMNKVYYKKIEGEDSYYEVIIEGTNLNGASVNEAVDLAYVHVESGNTYKCLGKVLKFKCDPCTKPFEWQGVGEYHG